MQPGNKGQNGVVITDSNSQKNLLIARANQGDSVNGFDSVKHGDSDQIDPLQGST